jgi:small ligand-binding sensory domain FIST
MQATTFSVLSSDLSGVGAAVREARGASTPSGAILFASGSMAESAERVLGEAQLALGTTPVVLATASGVLTERGEQEGASALAGLVWRGGSVASLFVGSDARPESVASSLAEQIGAALGERPGTAVLFAQPQACSTRTLQQLGRAAPRVTVIGGGTLPRGALAATPSGKVALGSVVGLVLAGLARPAVRATPACRLLAPLAPVTEARGSMVLRLGAQPALDRLTSSASSLTGRPLVLAVIAHDPSAATANATLLRGIRGVDPARKGVVVSDEIAVGTLMSFAVCDPDASRASFTGGVRDVERQLAGSAPQFGLLMTCASRGRALYGEPGVDAGIVRQRFPHLPFAGMFSSFEIAPFEERPALHLYAGALAVFGAPS